MLKPVDVASILYLRMHPGQSYAHMATLLGVSTSTAHQSVRRLEHAGLAHRLADGHVAVANGPALEFLQSGARYAFAPTLVAKARGVPTGLSAFVGDVRDDLPDAEPMVWPSKLGQAIGIGVEPLTPGAADLATRDPDLYRALAAVDAHRTGDARGREFARAELARVFEVAQP